MNVFITGASSGLGAALAHRYALGGWTLGLTARNEAALRELARAVPVRTAVYPLDIRDGIGLAEAAGDFIASFGVPDVVIANAGISAGTLTEHPEDRDVFREILEINVAGIVNTFQPFIVPMRGRRRGTLAGIASVAGFRGLAGAGAYSASKAAAIAYLESLRLELRGDGITVTTLCPGYIRTPMTARNPYPMPFILDADDAARRLIRAIAAGRRYATIPWQMAAVGYFLRRLPIWLYDPIFARAGRKPRRRAGDERPATQRPDDEGI